MGSPFSRKYYGYFSHLKPSSGSIRISVLDISRMKIFADRENAIGFDWDGWIKKLVEQNSQNSIDIASLGTHPESLSLFIDQINKIMQQDTCAPGAMNPLKIIIVLSDFLSGKITFAKDSAVTAIEENENIARIISARKAEPHERQKYEEG
jgi:hypothetical protein